MDKGVDNKKIDNDFSKVREMDSHTQTNVIVELQQIQDKFGYLPKEELINLSKRLNIPGIDIYGVATFYSQFKLQAPGKYKISVCNGTACHVKDSSSIVSYLEEFLKIKVGETTKDGLITLETVNCIGACAKAPAMMVGDTVYGNLTKDEVKKIIETLK